MNQFKKIFISFLKLFKKIEFLFLLILIIGFFLLSPPSFNYGDHASYRIIFQQNLASYLKVYSNYPGNFDDYVKEKYKTFHGSKLASFNAFENYLIEPKVELNWILNPNYYSVYILPRLSELLIYYLFFGQFGFEVVEAIFGLLLFILIYIYAYKLGSILIDKYFGIIIAVLTVSNLYFNQLTRSMINEFNNIYILLFFTSFYYLLLLHKKNNKKKLLSGIGFAVSISFCFLNGYPSTNFILLGLIFVFFIFYLIFLKITKNKEYKLLKFSQYLIISFSIIYIILFFTMLWSNILGENFLYGLKIILNDRIWGYITRGEPIPTANYNFELWQIPYVIKNVLDVLFVQSKAHVGPHEPSFLMDLPFFNLIESIMFILGLFYLFKNIFNKKIESFFLTVIFVFFCYRVINNSANYLLIGRYTFDFYFFTILFSAYGFFCISKTIFYKMGNNRIYIIYLILLISALINIRTFNIKFVHDFDESLKQLSGLNELRNFYKNEVAKNNNLYIYEFNYSNATTYHIDLVSLLENRVDYDTFNMFFNTVNIDSLESFKYFLKTSGYENVFVVIPVGLTNTGKSLQIEPLYNFHNSARKFSDFFSPYNFYKEIKNRRGIPTFWIYKFTKNNPYYVTAINTNENIYNIQFDKKEKLNFIDFPGNIEKAIIKFSDGNKINLDLSKISFDRFHFSLDEKSVIDIFNNFNFDLKDNNIIESEATRSASESHDGVDIVFFDAVNFPSKVIFKYELPFPIKKAYINVPFVFLNDQSLNNKFQTYYKTPTIKEWILSDEKRSNGNMRFTEYDNYDEFGSYPLVYPHTYNNSFNIINNINSNIFYFQYKLFSIFPQSVRPYSSYYWPEHTNNFVKMELDTSKYSKYKKIITDNIIIELTYKNINKGNTYNKISIGTK